MRLWVHGTIPAGEDEHVVVRTRESEVLDFKAVFWMDKGSRPRGEEIAKDVAAFLNHRGGVLAVGICDEDDRASGLSDVALPASADQTIRQALERHLAPQASAGAVQIYQARGTHAGATSDVLIVEVRGWPHGPVAVRSGDGAFRLPVRRGAHTELIPWEEAMRLLTAGHRRDWLRFKEWHEQHPRLPTFVGTGIRAVAFDGALIPILCPIEGHFAELEAVRDDVIHLRILRTAFVKWQVSMRALRPAKDAMVESGAGPFLALLGLAGEHDAWNASMPMTMAVPFELIRAAWVEGMDRQPRLHLLLAGDLVFGGERWYVRP